jgi:acyl-CoA synthetase (AMP-forming)/AMP-acid ligase II
MDVAVCSSSLTIPGLLQLRIERDADRLAVVTEEQSITYAELDGTSAKIAAFLVKSGVTRGARVGLIMQNGVDWVCAAVAVMRMGAVLAPLSTFLRPRELEQQLRIAAVTHLVVTEGFNNREYLSEIADVVPSFTGPRGDHLQDEALPSLRRVWGWPKLRDEANELDSEGIFAQIAKALGHAVTPADDMVILFTSGSSGSPKGIIHTHGSAIRGVAVSLPDRGVRRDDRLYLPMPLFWTGGFGMGLITALMVGATLLTEALPEPGRTLRFLERERVTLFRGWPDQAVHISKHPNFKKTGLPSLRAGSLDALLPAALRAKSPKSRASLLGMTETMGPYCCYRLDMDMPEEKWGSSGRVQPGVDVRIVEPSTGAVVPPGSPGAIKVRGRNVMRGICGRQHHEVFDADGFYDTGDLGIVDKDGFLFYMGRKDDMFKARGATVYPSEVERALLEIPGIARAFVTDVAIDEGAREVGAAVIAAEGRRLDVDELIGTLRQRLSSFKMPTRWLVMSTLQDIPMLSSGKVDKAALREVLASRGIESKRPASDPVHEKR